MSKKRLTITIIVVAILLILGFDSFYQLDERQQAHLFKFGKPIGEDIITAGIHMKIPFIIEVKTYERRWIPWQGDEDELNTSDKIFINTNTFGRWRITNCELFQKSVGGSYELAQSRLDDAIDGATRRMVAKHTLTEVLRTTGRPMKTTTVENTEEGSLDEVGMTVATTPEVHLKIGRSAMEDSIQAQAAFTAEAMGIEIRDVGFIKLNYISQVEKKIFGRMISERERSASYFESRGQGAKADIEGKMQKELDKIESESIAKAQEIMGIADATAAKIYNDAYSAYGGFYAFSKSLEVFETSVDSTTELILTTDMPMFKALQR